MRAVSGELVIGAGHGPSALSSDSAPGDSGF